MICTHFLKFRFAGVISMIKVKVEIVLNRLGQWLNLKP